MTAAVQGITVSPKQLVQLLVACFGMREPVLIKGAPGIGKSDCVAEAAKLAGMDILISHPVTADPTDAKGLPWKRDGLDEATFLPFGDLAIAMKATTPLVWFLDDLGQASPAVQASFMQLVLARRVNGHKLPDCVTFAAATNRRGDRAGVSGILEPVKGRFTIVELHPNLDSFVEWAVGNSVPASVIGFLRNRPELLIKFEPTADITNGPNPRNWAALGRLQDTLPQDANIRMAGFSGRIGDADAASYVGFLEILEKAPDPDYILMDPDKAKLPSAENPGIAYAVALALAYRAEAKTLGSIIIYARRMYNEGGLAEFSALLLRDSVRTIGEDKIVKMPPFMKLAGEPMAKDLFAAIQA